MERYKIEFKKSAAKEIRKLPAQDVKKILSKINSLAEHPRPLDSVKLTTDDHYRVRCGDYRIIYSIRNEVLIVTVVKVGHRKDVYRER